MKNILFFILLSSMIFGLSSCIDELGIDTQVTKNILVVEGTLTTEKKEHVIKITKSAKYGSILDDNIKKISGARVFIRDEDGNQVVLSEKSPGIYKTPIDFGAEVGKTYSLKIVLDNGESYLSAGEKVVAVPPIDSIIPVWKKKPSLSDLVFDSGVDVFVRFQDPGDVQNFYRWKIFGVYKIMTHPELYVENFFGTKVPRPKDCCAECYVSEEVKGLYLFKDNLVNGNQATPFVAHIKDDGGRFMERYMIVVEQRSLTRDAYRFYDLLKNQLSIDGDIFDPPPATVTTNVINLDHPDDPVIGFFAVSDRVVDTIFINHDFMVEPQSDRQINDDCRVLKNSTTDVPPFWK